MAEIGSARSARDYEEESNLETGTHADDRLGSSVTSSAQSVNQHSLAPLGISTLGGDTIWRQGRADRTR